MTRLQGAHPFCPQTSFTGLVSLCLFAGSPSGMMGQFCRQEPEQNREPTTGRVHPAIGITSGTPPARPRSESPRSGSAMLAGLYPGANARDVAFLSAPAAVAATEPHGWRSARLTTSRPARSGMAAATLTRVVRCYQSFVAWALDSLCLPRLIQQMPKRVGDDGVLRRRVADALQDVGRRFANPQIGVGQKGKQHRDGGDSGADRRAVGGSGSRQPATSPTLRAAR